MYMNAPKPWNIGVPWAPMTAPCIFAPLVASRVSQQCERAYETERTDVESPAIKALVIPADGLGVSSRS